MSKPFGARAEGELHAVHQRRPRQRRHIVHRRRQAPAQQRARAHGQHQSLSRARARAPRDVLVHARIVCSSPAAPSAPVPESTPAPSRPPASRRTSCCKRISACPFEHALRLRIVQARRLDQNPPFDLRIRVGHVDLQQEAIELRFRQRIGAFVLDRVLRRQHMERRRHVVRRARHRHVMLLHRLQQRRLRARRCAVDFVGHQAAA